ncbi:hypothetical protein [Mycobacteroides abscessus]
MLTLATDAGILPPPTDLHANQTVAWAVLWLVGVGLVGTLAAAVIIARRDRNPLFLLLLVSGAVLFPFCVEPAGDIIFATWYPADTPVIAATILGRHIPLFVVLGYAAGIPVACYAAYQMIVRGAAVKSILVALAAISISEGIVEMTAVHFGFMKYYGNHALIFGVPLSTLVQNAGMFTVIGVALAWIKPHLHGWRWAIVPLVPPAVFMSYVIACTMPNFYAIHGQMSPAPFWGMALISTVLNAGVGVGALYTETARRYRDLKSGTTHAIPTAATTAA